MATIIQLRNDTLTNWASYNPILAEGELGIEMDTRKFKIGNGITPWNGLQYFKSGNVDSVNGQTGVVVLTVGDIATEIQMQSINSGANTTNIGQITTNKNAIGTLSSLSTTAKSNLVSAINEVDSDVSVNTGAISTINSKIPSQATSSNQLADKNFVNSSIATNTANFIGTFESISALEAYSGTVTNNDYAFVVNQVVTDNGNDWATFNDLDAYDKSLLTNMDYAWVVDGSNFDLYWFDIVQQEWQIDTADIPKDGVTLNYAYNRYKASVSENVITWQYEYTLNNSSFTANQWAAINSGATTTNIGQITTNQNAIGTLSSLTTTVKTDLVSAINELDSGKQDTLTPGTGIDITNGTISNSGVRSVSTGSTNGTISVNTGGTSAEVSVYGLGSAAYTPATDYATSSQGGKADTSIQGVKTNGTELTPDASNKVNIPLMTSTVFGIAKLGSGLQMGSSGDLKTYKATDSMIEEKSNAYMPIVPSSIDKTASVMARSVYDKTVAITSGAINIDEGSVFYTDSPSSATTYTISTTATTQTGFTYRYFNVLINMPSTPVGIDFTTNNTITWTENTTPDMSTGGRTYLLAFQTFDGGISWIGSLATWWKTPTP